MAAPVPPPATERVPERVGVKVKLPAVGTIFIPMSWPLRERVEVEKVK